MLVMAEKIRKVLYQFRFGMMQFGRYIIVDTILGQMVCDTLRITMIPRFYVACYKIAGAHSVSPWSYRRKY